MIKNKKNRKFFFNNLFFLSNIFFIFLFFLLPSCTRDKKTSLKLINVLDKTLFDDVHIAGSEHVSFEDLDKKILTDWKNLDKNTVFVFYCSNYACSASGQAAKQIEQLGFKESYAYEGGMAEWFNLHKQDKSYRIVGEAKQRYLNMPNPIKLIDHDYKVITAARLKELLG